MLELHSIPNFIKIGAFLFFGPNLPKTGIFGSKTGIFGLEQVFWDQISKNTYQIWNQHA